MKTNRLLKLIIALSIISISLCSCFVDGPNSHFCIFFTNNANHSIYVYDHPKEDYLYSPNPPQYYDTVLLPYYYNPLCDSFDTKYNPGKEECGWFFSMDCYECMFGYEYDTLLIFIFNADTLETYGWDTVREYYKVEQWYDLILEDLQKMDFKLSFPPTEAMKHIHMWPPYGTYDEHGRRKDN